MRVHLLVKGSNVALSLGLGLALSLAVVGCSFSPNPASGVATGSGNPGTSTGVGTGNPFGGSSGTATGAGTGAANSGGNVNPDSATCGGQNYNAQNVPPDLLIILDKSGSMDQQADGMACPGMGAACPTQKWPAMVAGLNQVVMATQAMVNWGLKYFPSAGGCGVNAGVEVGVAPNNSVAIMGSLGMNNPNGNTPTRAAVTAGAAYLMGLADANPKYILLATDGLPNCPAMGGGNGTADDGPATAAIMASAAAGIPVFVVGVGTIAGALTTLNGFAVAGGRPRAGDPKYYQVDSTADLVSVLTMLTGQIASCTFGLNSVPPVPGNIAVYGDGVRIPESPTDGWSYGTGMRSIVLNGPTCDKVKAKQIVNVTTYFGCPGEVIK
jgi:hypothetical protein